MICANPGVKEAAANPDVRGESVGVHKLPPAELVEAKGEADGNIKYYREELEKSR